MKAAVLSFLLLLCAGCANGQTPTIASPQKSVPVRPVPLTEISFEQSVNLSYNQTYSLAEQTGRPWLVLLTASWCEPCHRLKTGTIPTLSRKGLFQQRRMLYTVIDIDKQPEIAQKLGDGSGSVPQLLLFRIVKIGQKIFWFVTRARGFLSPEQMTAFVDEGTADKPVVIDEGTADKPVVIDEGGTKMVGPTR